MNASRSAYYRWLKQPESQHQRRDTELKQEIFKEYYNSGKVYGSPRVYHSLKKRGECCSEKRVSRLMKELSIRSESKPKFKITTNSSHKRPVAENILDRRFKVDNVNEYWVSYISYISTLDGWLYLSIVMDLYSRKIVGWSMGNRQTNELVIRSIQNALDLRKPRAGLLFHSDQGSQYASKAVQELLEEHEMFCSMSRKGECYDNAVAESFFDSLKSECIKNKGLKSRNETKQVIFKYIESFYNRSRLHSTLGYKSPVEYEAIFSR
jgi:transposase InsO family protein